MRKLAGGGAAMKVQNTETMNRLNTLPQMKKARATQAWVNWLKALASRFSEKKASQSGGGLWGNGFGF